METKRDDEMYDHAGVMVMMRGDREGTDSQQGM
jgi:hypothetical protein